jgi:hypothetical protein
MLAGLLWKPWVQGGSVLKRKRANTRVSLVVRVLSVSFKLLGDQAFGLTSHTSTPMIGVLVRWAHVLWSTIRGLWGRLCALMCLSLVQEVLQFNHELVNFFQRYWVGKRDLTLGLGTALIPSRKKRFLFVKQRPKRFLLWYWGSTLVQYSCAAVLQRKPITCLRVLSPLAFFLKKRKLGVPRG